MKQCIYCNIDIEDNATVCPHCHQKQANNFFWNLAVIIAVIGAVCVLVGVIGSLLHDETPDNTYGNDTLAKVITIEYPYDMF